MITAIVLINTAQGHTPEVAQALMELPGIAAEKNNRNLELFAKEVMPHIR